MSTSTHPRTATPETATPGTATPATLTPTLTGKRPPGAGDRLPPPEQEARFARALRPSVMGRLLAEAFGGDPRRCHVLDAKFEPDRRAMVLYQLGDSLFRGDLLLSDGPVALDGQLLGPAGVVVWPFPHDPDLPGLPPLMAGAAGVAGNGRSAVSLLRYRPGKRATVLFRGPVPARRGPVRTASARTAAPARTAPPRTVPARTVLQVAKVYHDPAKAAAVAAEAAELSRVTRSCRHLRLAPVLAHLPDQAIVIHQALPGRSLQDLIDAAPRDGATLQAVTRAAAALAELHRLPRVSARRRPVENELARFLLRAERVASVDPRLGGALAVLASRLSELATALPAARTGLVHGDCKPGQFLVGGDRVVLLDLDHCGVSDQAGDPGTFLATLRQRAVQQRLAGGDRRRDALAVVAELFLAVYLQAAPDQSSPRIGWQLAVALERKALRSFARAPRSPLAGALVEEAHRCLDAVETRGESW